MTSSPGSTAPADVAVMSDIDALLVDGPAIARDLGLSPGTINNWASAGHITRRGRDAHGRSVFDYDEVKAWATRDRSRHAVAHARGEKRDR